MISDLISRLQQKIDLTYDQINYIMTEILSGKTNDKENIDFLSSLTEKGETDDENLQAAVYEGFTAKANVVPVIRIGRKGPSGPWPAIYTATWPPPPAPAA